MIQPPKSAAATLNRLARSGGATGPIKAQPEAGKNARKRSRRDFHGRPAKATFADDRSKNLLPRPPVSDRHRFRPRRGGQAFGPPADASCPYADFKFSKTLRNRASQAQAHRRWLSQRDPKMSGPAGFSSSRDGRMFRKAISALCLARACEARYGHGHHVQKS